MKKWLAMLLACILLLGLVGCGVQFGEVIEVPLKEELEENAARYKIIKVQVYTALGDLMTYKVTYDSEKINVVDNATHSTCEWLDAEGVTVDLYFRQNYSLKKLMEKEPLVEGWKPEDLGEILVNDMPIMVETAPADENRQLFVIIMKNDLFFGLYSGNSAEGVSLEEMLPSLLTNVTVNNAPLADAPR